MEMLLFGLYSVGLRDNDFDSRAIRSASGFDFFLIFLSCGAGFFESFSRFFKTIAKRSGGLGLRRGFAFTKFVGAFGFGLATGLGLTFGFAFGFGLGFTAASGGGGTTTTFCFGAGGGGGGDAFFTFGVLVLAFGLGLGFDFLTFFGGSGAEGKFVKLAKGTISTTMGISSITGGFLMDGKP